VIRRSCIETTHEARGRAGSGTFKTARIASTCAENEKNKLVNKLSRGDELPTGVLEMVKVLLATKRRCRSATRWPAVTATRA
jgi:hypothetical protein